MSLIIFKYCLPALLRKPQALIERPAWFLGVWTGMAVALVLTLGLHMAYHMSLDSVQQLLKPTAWLLTGVLLPGFIGYFFYRGAIHRDINAKSAGHLLIVDDSESELMSFDSTADTHFDDFPLADAVDTHIEEAAQDEQLDTHVEDASLDEQLDTHIEDAPLAEQLDTHIEDAAQDAQSDTHVEDAPLAEQLDTHAEDAPLDEQLDTHIEDAPLAQQLDTHIEDAPLAEQLDTHEDEASITFDLTAPDEHLVDSPSNAILFDMIEMPSDDAHSSLAEKLNRTRKGSTPQRLLRGITGAEAEEKLNDTYAEIAALRQTLTEEIKLRRETESHLRISRKALGTLESESRNFESSKASALIGLEEELENRHRETAAAEARVSRIEAERATAETEIITLKQDLLQAKREVRRSTAARAKALNTANKAVAFARQAVQARGRAEARLREGEDSLKNRQETISSLIKALEKEKRRTEDDVAAMAKEMVLHEKQLYARRSLEEVARTMDGKLTSRLVKKVAKARPLANDG